MDLSDFTLNPQWATIPLTEMLAWCEIDPETIPTKRCRLEILSRANRKRCAPILDEVLENVDAILNQSKPSLSILLMNNYIQYLCENGFASKLTDPISKKIHRAALSNIEPLLTSLVLSCPELAIERLIECYNSWSDTLKRLSMRCMHLNNFHLKFSKKYDDIERLGNDAFMKSTLSSGSSKAFSLFNPADPPIRQKVFVNAVDICRVYIANPGSEESAQAFKSLEQFFNLVDMLDPTSKVIGQPHLVTQILEKSINQEISLELPSRLQRMEADVKSMFSRMSYIPDDMETQIFSPISDLFINKRADEIIRELLPELFARLDTHCESIQYIYKRVDELHKVSVLNTLRTLINKEVSRLINMSSLDKYQKIYAAHQLFSKAIEGLKEDEGIDFKPLFAPVVFKECSSFARFVDLEVKKFYTKGAIDSSFKSLVNFILPHFSNYIHFWQSYINYLSKRLIVRTTQAGKVALSQINIEKQVFDIFLYPQDDVKEKVSRMISDVEHSGSLNDDASNFCGLVVNDKWPKMPPNDTLKLHSDLHTPLQNFENAYLERNSSRTLEWSYFSSLVTLNFNVKDSFVEITCNAYIATVLLLFNAQPEYCYDELKSESGLPDASLKDVLFLCCSKDILIKRDDCFAVNQMLKGGKVHLAANKKTDSLARKEVSTKIEGPLDLRPMIRARVVRVLKQKRTCSHTTLMRDLKGLLQEDYNPPDIKTIIESLIEQQYIARKDLRQNYNIYVYLP